MNLNNIDSFGKISKRILLDFSKFANPMICLILIIDNTTIKFAPDFLDIEENKLGKNEN